ncbi:hypothetical protein [Enterococcus gallinarum]|uniref:hypothetical protein n=1 Tax=Enterococcus gallinarum TaxID=1353 RepID=UPI00214C1B2F|nr:hypothetical protein [Enterococcus gallinarum]MCR1930272.1 hypothetical protein [Enterococcus gallinarum]
MALYQLSNLKMKEIKEEVFAKEKQLQELIEENLESLFNLDFVASEFTVGNFRLDTVAYDSDTKSFVIIEYKKGKRYSVIDQGYAYLNTLLAHKGDFVLKYNEYYPNQLKKLLILIGHRLVLFLWQMNIQSINMEQLITPSYQ